MRRWFRRSVKGQGGFTLPEMLVVVALLGILAAVAVPNVGRFIGTGNTKANATEKQTVQTAMDGYMAELAVTLVAANTTATDFSGTTDPPLGVGYLRVTPARCTYTWADDGTITQVTCP